MAHPWNISETGRPCRPGHHAGSRSTVPMSPVFFDYQGKCLTIIFGYFTIYENSESWLGTKELQHASRPRPPIPTFRALRLRRSESHVSNTSWTIRISQPGDTKVDAEAVSLPAGNAGE